MSNLALCTDTNNFCFIFTGRKGFSESVFEALTVKTKVMNERDHNVSLVFDDMIIKQALLYNKKCETIEGFEDFGFIR